MKRAKAADEAEKNEPELDLPAEIARRGDRLAGIGATEAAIKLHTLLDLRGAIPSFVHISAGKMNDVRGFDLLTIEPGACYLLDRGYLDFERLFKLNSMSLFFVTRAKCNTMSPRTRM